MEDVAMNSKTNDHAGFGGTEAAQFGGSGQLAYSPLVGEMTGKRAEAERHFRREDGAYEAVAYPYEVNYQADGKWHAINNTLKEDKDEKGNAIYRNADSDLKVAFCSALGSGEDVSLEYQGYSLAWTVKNAKGSVTVVEPEPHEDPDMRMRFPVELKAVVDYPDALNGADLRYCLAGKSLSEYIKLTSREQISESYTYHMRCGKLDAKLEEDGRVTFSGKDGKPVFVMKAPRMHDADAEESGDIEVTLDQKETELIYTIKPSAEWLKDDKRAYPVIIDPEVKTFFRSCVADANVTQTNPDLNDGGSGYIRAGNPTYYYRAFIKLVSLPTLSAGDLVTESTFHLAKYTNNSGLELHVHRVTEPWSESTLTWNTRPEYDASRVEEAVSSCAQHQWNGFNITRLVKKWYAGEYDNYGIMIKPALESETCLDTAYYSSEYSLTGGYDPYFRMVYVNTTGIEDIWTYQTQNIGRAGTAYVNSFNGNLILKHSDAVVPNGRLGTNANYTFPKVYIIQNGVVQPSFGSFMSQGVAFNPLITNAYAPPLTYPSGMLMATTPGNGKALRSGIVRSSALYDVTAFNRIYLRCNWRVPPQKITEEYARWWMGLGTTTSANYTAGFGYVVSYSKSAHGATGTNLTYSFDISAYTGLRYPVVALWWGYNYTSSDTNPGYVQILDMWLER